MNYFMVSRLIGKDWYLNRWAILAAVLGGFLTLGLIAAGGTAGFTLGIIVLVTILISIGAALPVSTIITEHKEQTLAFVMSLPVSYREYTASKLLGNLLLFLVPWLGLVLGSFAVLLFVPGMAHGLLPFVAIMAVEILVSTCLISSVALVTESQGWTIGTILVGNLALNAFGYYVAHIASIAEGMKSATIHWTAAASALLSAEFAAIVLLLSLTFFFQARKKSFL